MSILSTNKKLISIGAGYSAGNGINITDHIISVVESAVGANYSAGPNIDIYDVEGQPTISSKDWSNDIDQASANAYEQAIAQIPAPQDLSYISAKVDTNTSGINYISSVCLSAHQDWTDTIKGASSYSYEQSTSYFDNWVNGQYTGDITNITNNISALSGNFGDYYKKTETSSKDEINDALQYVSANAGKVYEGVSPIVVNNDEDKISADTWVFSAGANVSFVDDNVNKITRIDCTITGEGGDPQVNSFVYNNSADIVDVNSSYKANSGTFLTAAPANMATTGDVAELAQTISESYYPNTNPSSFVSEDWVTAQGYLTAHQSLDNYYTKDETSGADELANAFSQIGPGGDEEVNELVHSNSGEWNNVSSKLNESTFQETSGLFLTAIPQEYITESELPNYISAKLDSSIFANVSGDFLVASSLNGYATESFVENVSGDIVNLIPDTSNFITNSSAEATYQPIGNYLSSNALEGYATNESLDTASSFLSGAIDYVSANAGSTLTGDAQGAVDNVYTNSSRYVLNNANGVYIGYSNTANTNGFAQGGGNKAEGYSIAQGLYNKANGYSIAQGQFCTASNESIAQGAGNSADNYSQAFGGHTKANNSGMAIGTYNNITTASFVIGNGNSNQRSDCFIIDHDGNVSACGKISANGVELGAGGGNPEVENYVQTNSAGIDDTVTSYQTNSGTFLTAHQDLSDYATTADLALKQDALTFGYDEQDRINSINSSALAVGGEVPEGTMVESNLEFNAVGEISGYNGSALTDASLNNIVQTNSGAWGGSALPISAGNGVKINLVNNTLVFSNDETVLFSATDSTGSTAQTITLSEPYTAFKRIKMYFSIDDGDAGMAEILTTCNKINCYTQCSQAPIGGICMYKSERYYLVNDNQISASPSASMIYWNNGTSDDTTQTGKCQTYSAFRVHEIYGINRIS